MKKENYRRDFELPGLIGQVEDCGDYVAFRTPNLPGFYWGNYLLFPTPPGKGDCDRWRSAFQSQFGGVEAVQHEAFGWDSPTGEVGSIQPFVDAGFRFGRGSVMVAERATRPPYLNAEVEVRAADSEVEWTAATDCIAEYSAEGVTRNRRLTRKLEIWREISEQGAGVFYNAYLNGCVAGGVGTHRFKKTVVIDDVATRSEFRRQGVARTAVYRACSLSIAHPDVDRLLLFADHGSAAERMYEQIGFRVVVQLLELIKT